MSGDDEKTEFINDNLSDAEEKDSLLENSESSLTTSSRSPSPEPESEPESESDEHTDNARFAQPPTSPIKRTFLLLFLILLFLLVHYTRVNLTKKPNIIYASRYSKEYKFRPAASAVITETLKDGRVRLRGALPTPLPSPPIDKKRRKASAGKVSGKRKKRGGMKSKPKIGNRQRI